MTVKDYQLINMSVNERISYLVKKYRNENALTQKELADLLFVEAQTVSAWERGIKTPSSDSITNLTNLMQISADLIYKGVEAHIETINHHTITKDSLIISDDKELGNKIGNLQYKGSLYEVTIYYKYRLYLWRPNLQILFPCGHTEKVKMGDSFTFYTDKQSGELTTDYYGQQINFQYLLTSKNTYFTFDTKRYTNGNCALVDTNAKDLKVKKDRIARWIPRIILYFLFSAFILFCLISLDI